MADATTPVPIREVPDQEDAFDGDRIRSVLDARWSPQDQLLQARDRTIEENVRCLAGRQWDVWSSVLGEYVDPTRYMTDEERRWRQRPVVNLLGYWFMLTHARLTENTPAVTFSPATADRLDAQLAQVLDPAVKTLWYQVQMDEHYQRLTAWLIAAGEAFVETAVDFTKGEERQLLGPAMLEGPDGQEVMAEAVPFDEQGNPLAAVVETDGGYGYEATGDPHTDRTGQLAPRVRSPLEVRAEWGSDTAWEDKRWIITLSYLTPEEVRKQYGVETTADTLGQTQAGFLERLLFSAGYFGASNGRLGSDMQGHQSQGSYVGVYTMWEKPCPDYPEGRLLVVTRDKVLHDSPRPYETKAAGPIRRAQFIQMPGRGGFGSTPLEQMIPIQKTYNRGWAQILEHRNLCTNPILITDSTSGIGEQVTNLPGSRIEIDMQQGVANPAYYLVPPSLPSDVWRIQSQLREELFLLGSMMGAEGQSPTDNASGELVSQLRYNSDRPVAIAARSLYLLVAGMVEDWVAILPTIWTDEQTIMYSGEDNIAKTIAILPELWSGSVNVRPDLVNARLEAPEAKEARALMLYEKGVLGPQGSPEANEAVLALGKFPHLGRFGKQGGPDGDTCRQALGQVAQGMPAQEVQLFPWYNYEVWTQVIRDHLASPEYLAYEPPVQMELAALFMMVQQAYTQSVMLQTAIQTPRMAAQVQAQGALAHVAQASSPQPPEDGQPGSTDSKPPAVGPSGPAKAA